MFDVHLLPNGRRLLIEQLELNLEQQGVNFINVFRTNFSYERHFSSYVLALSKNLYKKRAQIKLMELNKGQMYNDID